MKKKFIQAKVSIQKDGKKITVIASDETLDRHGEVLPIEQWDLNKFMQSPRMLVDHDHQVEKIVGKWENPRIVGKELLMDANFHDFTPLAKAVQQMVEEGYLNTVSVGFIPHGASEDGGRETFELIETSWVTVPANPNAQVQAAFKAIEGKQLSAEEKQKLETFAKDLDVDQKPENEEEAEEAAGDGEPDEIKDVVTDTETFKKLAEDSEVVAVTYAFLSQLIKDSEQLKTLTADKQAMVEAATNKQIVRLALKKTASLVSHSLRELNK